MFMKRLLKVLALAFAIIALGPSASAMACGDDGQEACGGECDWYSVGWCPFCIPRCHRNPYFCHEGNGLKTHVVGVDLDGTLETIQVCSRTAPVTVDVERALQEGCYEGSEIRVILDEVRGRSDLGEMTRRKLQGFDPGDRDDGWATRRVVDDPNTWGYRAPTIPKEAEALMSGKLVSKAQRQLSRSVDPTFFWSQNGPQLSGLLDDASSPTRLGLSLQMLATSSSDEPKSQFVSVALDYEVASGFGETVYKFQLNPRSPVLGLRGCRMGGETQFQVPGSTPIRNLHRRVRTNGYWERYVTDKQAWERVP